MKKVSILILMGINVIFSQSKVNNIETYPTIKKITKITKGQDHHFASAYYGQHSWSKSERYVLCLKTPIEARKPNPNDIAKIGMIDLQDNNKFIPLAKTRAWNFQQGAFVQWLGSSPDSLIIYNDCRKGKFISVVLNVHTGKERLMDRAILGVSNDGKKAIGVNFNRLEKAIKGFGYVGGEQNAQVDVQYPDNDGLYLLDIETAKSKLVVTMKDISRIAPPPSDIEGPMLWFHHAHFNPSDSRVFFVAKTRKSGKPMASAAFTMDSDGSDITLNVPYSWDATHYDWLDDKHMVVTSAYKKKMRTHLVFTDGVKDDYRRISQNLIQSNGHPTFSPDKKWMLTDTYPDVDRKISMFLVNLKNETVYTLGRFFTPKQYSKAVRCDLHADWNYSGNKILYDSTEDGSRQIYIMELDFKNVN